MYNFSSQGIICKQFPVPDRHSPKRRMYVGADYGIKQLLRTASQPMQIRIQGIPALLSRQSPILVDQSPYVTLLAMLSE